MSKLDNLYTNYRRYCKEIANRRNGSIITKLIIHEDGSGVVETKLYIPTNGNPFNVVTDEVVKFNTPFDGATKLKELLDGHSVHKLSKSQG